MAARADILEKVKKSRQEAEKRIQESNKKDEQARQASKREYQQNTSSDTKQSASYMKQYSTPERAGNTVSDYSQKRKQMTSWYKGDKPTEIETLAKIVKETERDRAFGEKLYGYYEQAKQEGEWAETYDKATSRYAAALGLPEGTAINDEFFEQMKPYFAAGVTTDAGNLSTAKKNGADALFAANLAGLYDDYQKTKTLKNESDNMFKEIQFWVDQGLTDDEIRKKVDIASNKSYSTLRKAMEKTATGEYEPTTEAIPALTSYGVDGMIWAARNPGKSTGDYKLDAVQGAMGRGAASPTQSDPRRDVSSASYAPYAVGMSGMDEYGIKYGRTTFDEEWLNSPEGQAVRNNPDTNKDFGVIYDAVEKTKTYKAAVDEFVADIRADIEAGVSPDEIFSTEMLDDYPEIRDLLEAQAKGNPLRTSESLNFDLEALYKEAETAYVKNVGKITSEEYEADLSEKLGAPSKQNSSTAGVHNQNQQQLIAARSIFARSATPEEKSVFATTSPGYADTKASALDGILNGTSAEDQAFYSAYEAADNYAAQFYLPALNQKASLERELAAIGKYEEFLAKWEPILEKEGQSVLASPEFLKAQGEAEYYKEVWQRYEGNPKAKEELLAAIKNEDTILARIDANYADANKLNKNGKEAFSVKPILDFVNQFNGYVPERFANTEWGERLVNGESWDAVSKDVEKQKATNDQLLIMIDTAIRQADHYGIGKEFVEGMTRFRESLIDENKMIEFSSVRANKDFSSVAAQFDATEGKAAETSKSRFGLFNVDNAKDLPRAEVLKYIIIDPAAAQSVTSATHNDDSAPAVRMNDSERETYKYIYMTEGAERAAEYFDSILPMLNVRGSEEFQAKAAEQTDTFFGSVCANALSVVANTFGGLAGSGALFDAVANGKELDPYSFAFWFTQYGSTVRSETKENISKQFGENSWEAKALNFAYDVATTTADSIASNKLAGSAGLYLMSANAGSSAAMDVLMRGGTEKQALQMYALTSFAEAASEWKAFDHLSDLMSNGLTSGFKKELIKQFTADVSGELANEIFTNLTDQMIMGELSNWELAKNQYIAEGMSEEDAIKKANGDVWRSLGYTILMSGGSSAARVGTAAGLNAMFKPKGNNIRTKAETALYEASAKGASKGDTAATVEAVMEAMGSDPVEASAAAHVLANVDPNVASTTASILAHTEDPSVMDALRLGSLVPDSKTGRILSDIQQNGATDENVADLIEVSKLESDVPEIQSQYGEAVKKNVEAMAVVNALLGTDNKPINDAKAAVTKAEQNLATQRKTVSDAEAEMQAATSALENAKKRFNAKPSDPKAKSAMERSVVRYQEAQKTLENARATTDIGKAVEELKAARSALETTRNELMTAARANAQTVVQDSMVQMEQRKAEAEQLRIAEQDENNLREMEFQNYLSEKAPNATPEQVEQLRTDFFATYDDLDANPVGQQAEKTPDEKNARFASTIGKRFNVNVEFRDTKGMFKGAYHRGTNTIVLDSSLSQGEAIFEVALHELTHKAESGGFAYNSYANSILDIAFGGDKKKIKAEIAARKERYNNRFAQMVMSGQTGVNVSGLKPLSNADAKKELVADLTRRVLYGDEQLINQLVESNPDAAYTFLDWIKDTVKRLVGIKGSEADRLNRTRELFEKALAKAEENGAKAMQKQAEESNHPSSVQFSIEQFTRSLGFTFEKTGDKTKPYRILDEDGNVVNKITADMVKPTPMGMLIDTAEKNQTVTPEIAGQQRAMVAEVMNLVTEYGDQAMVWELVGSELFSAIKSNSDKQYGTTVDFGTICSKTREVVNVMSEAMLKKGRGLTRDEVLAAYRQTHDVGLAVPCPVCYVFSRWMGVPSLLETMRKGQERFSNATAEEVNAYLKSVEAKYSQDGKKLSQVMSGAKSSLLQKLEEIDTKLRKGGLSATEENALIKQSRGLQKELDDVELYNWVCQVRAKTDKSGKHPVRDKDGNVVLDPNYKPVPNEVLLDLRQTGTFAADYAKSWKFRTTRGAGMGKAILPYGGAELGDSISGTKRWSAKQNPYFSGNEKKAASAMKAATIRAKAQNLIGGQRFQSTSDYRPEWGLDYIMTFLEMQAIGAKGQLYTKVIEAVDMFASAGIEVNLSIMPKGDGYHMENGKPVLGVDDFSSVTGIDFTEAEKKTREYDNVQMILVGINDDHIKAAMADDRISFIIPWHSSGNSQKTLDEMIKAVGEVGGKKEDYTSIQSDKVGDQTDEQKAAWELRKDILTGKFRKKGKKEAQTLTDEQREILGMTDEPSPRYNKYLADLYNKFYVDESSEAYGVTLSASQASQIFPHEYWDTQSTLDNADTNGKRFVEYCETMGIEPRFGKFKDEPGYWKLLIDRRMYNRDKTYHHPQKIDVTNVKIGSVASEVSQAKVGTKDQISKAAQATLDEIDARMSERAYDVTVDNENPYAGSDVDMSGAQFSFGDDEADVGTTDADVRREEMRAWRNERAAKNESLPVEQPKIVKATQKAVDNPPVANAAAIAPATARTIPDGKKERQFVSDTMYDSEVIPDYIREELAGNDETRWYDVDTNANQVKRAIGRIRNGGVQNEVDRLLSLNKYSEDDMAESAVLIAMASHENNAEVLFALTAHDAVARTTAGKTLQATKILQKMTPTGMQAFVAADSQRKMMAELDKRSEKAKALDRSAQNISQQISKIDANAFATTDNKWGVKLTERKLALIKLFGLENVARPGLHYNRATLDQRMLEAILATSDPTAVVGGVSLIQRLVYMQAGIPVATIADLNYIKTQMGTFALSGGEDGGRDADLAISRAYEAYGNITPVTKLEKVRTWRYVNMLSSFTSFARNIIGNTAQNAVNAAAHGVGVVVDKAVGSKTHKRTTTTLNVKERMDGWNAFKQETINTFRDFFIDKANTAPNRDKYDTHQHGRSFQTSVLEGAKNVESFMMSVGDRNIWKKNFVNSMAEQQKLAERGLLWNDDGSEVTTEQMIERAEADASYSTFTEDNLIQDLMSYLRRRNKTVADIVSLYLPFTGVPTNIMTRGFQYSPVGFITAGVRYAINKAAGKPFDQHAFVNDVARAFTGTMGVVAGAVLGAAGFIRMGSEEEDKTKGYDAATALGEQFTPYVYDPFTETYVSMSTFAPAASPLVWGASIANALKNDEYSFEAFLTAACGCVNSIFDASYLSGLGDIFDGGISGENILQTGLTNISSSLTPAWMNQLANALDPYVRDTKDKSFIVGMLKTTASRIPGVRNLLPEKVNVAGENVMTRGAWSFVDPFQRTEVSDNAALIEAKRLYDVTRDTSVLPTDALRSKNNTFSISGKLIGKKNAAKVTLDDYAKAEYKKRYGELWTTAMQELLDSGRYWNWSDDEKADKVAKIMTDALNQVKLEFYQMYGADEE